MDKLEVAGLLETDGSRFGPAFNGALDLLNRQPWLAHSVIFAGRHTEDAADAHRSIVADLSSAATRGNIEGFRGIGKTTYAEEAILLRLLFGKSRNFVIVGSSHTRACDRLGAIKNQIVVNPVIEELFGQQKGPVWQQDRIVLANGACLQALGRDQSTLGIKYNDLRPDGFLIDDVEDPQEKRSDPEREESWKWLIQTFLPSLEHPLLTWGRHLGTRRGVLSMAERLQKNGWASTRYPIEYPDPATGQRTATWPAKFPLPVIDELKQNYRSDLATFDEEYMCLAGAASGRVFSRDLLKCEPRPRAEWPAVYAMYDPARTVGRKSATTGRAVWSYERHRIIFWKASAHEWLPDELIDDLFRVQQEFSPVWLGFEEDGLNEWAKQPIRAEALRRRVTLPLLPVKAPKGKLDFIRGLQPYMAAGEIIFAGDPLEFSDALDQFLSFPRGRIDAPNACAYALLLRPGAPVFESFADEHVAASLRPEASKPAFLAANSDGSLVAAALLQRVDGELRILADWVREGSPAEICADIHTEACLAADSTVIRTVTELEDRGQPYKLPVTRQIAARVPVRWVVPAWHQEQYRNVGLVQSIRQIPAMAALGGDSERGRALVSDLLSRRLRDRPSLLVSPAARWTLRAFAGGYARQLNNRGLAAAQPDAGIYRLLMEGIESFAAIGAALGPGADDSNHDSAQPMGYTRQGVAYASALPNNQRGIR